MFYNKKYKCCFPKKKKKKGKKGFWTINSFFSGLRLYFMIHVFNGVILCQIGTVNYYRKALHLGCCSSPRSASLNHAKFLDYVTLISWNFFEIFTSGRYHRDMKALKILASGSKHFRIYGNLNKWQIGVPQLTF